MPPARLLRFLLRERKGPVPLAWQTHGQGSSPGAPGQEGAGETRARFSRKMHQICHICVSNANLYKPLRQYEKDGATGRDKKNKRSIQLPFDNVSGWCFFPYKLSPGTDILAASEVDTNKGYHSYLK